MDKYIGLLKSNRVTARIEYTFPQFVPTLLPMMPNGNYGVQLERIGL